MGCVQASTMSLASVGPSSAAASPASAPRVWNRVWARRLRGDEKKRERLRRDHIRLIKKFLPSYPQVCVSTVEDRTIAGDHWTRVYQGGRHSVSTITKLYDCFYEYLMEHSPELMPVFRASMHVRSKVLVHISHGMRSLLATDNFAVKVQALTKTHLHVGVALEHFEPLANALFHAMKVTSHEHWTPPVELAWRTLYVHCSAFLMAEQKRMGRGSTRFQSLRTPTRITSSSKNSARLKEPSVDDIPRNPHK